MSDFISFSEFHQKVHGYDPYNWQRDLAEIVDREKRFPDQVSVPTGMGKTTALDIAVWALAKDLHDNGVEGRKIPQRIFMTVDRRLVVDGAYRHAQKIENAIENNADLLQVRHALRLLHVDEIESPTIRITSMHGGRKFSRDWLTTVGCQIITSTVAQYGSRLLFRGIGVSNGVLPMHAAVVGMDSVVFMDEPHLTPVASMLVRECSEMQGDREGLPPAVQGVLLGATIPPEIYVSHDDMDIFSPDLREEPSQEAQRRLSPQRPLELVKTTKKTEETMATLACDLIEELSEVDEDKRGDGILVSCNSIARAQKIADSLQKKYSQSEWRVQLITSTIRPYSREVDHYFDGNTITVATQTIEVGVDINCYGLVTEMASLPALTQRVGRLNRNGRIDNAHGFIVAKHKLNTDLNIEVFQPENSDMMIYDPEVLDATWEAINAIADNGHIDRLPSMSNHPECWAPLPRTTALAPYVKAMTMTRPRVDFPWDFFIYGDKDNARREVEVAWRSNLDNLHETPLMNPEKITISLSAIQDFVKSWHDHFDDSSDCPIYHFSKGEWQRVKKYYHINPNSEVAIHSSLGGYSDSRGWIGFEENAEWTRDISHKVALHSGEGRFSLSLLFSPQEFEQMKADQTIVQHLKDHPLMQGVSYMVSGDIVHVRESSSSTRVKGDSVLLADHAEQTRRLAEKISHQSSWSNNYVRKIADAAFHHDDGKIDPSFQGQLGNLDLKSPLAKSGLNYTPFSAPPSGWRHEVLSARSSDDLLVRHLIFSHHGWGRPMVQHGNEVLDTSKEFNHTQEELGVWGAALAESTLRLADWEASANPERIGRKWSNPCEKDLQLSPLSVDSKLPHVVTSITGVNKYSLTGILAALGALFTATRSGDKNAMIRFAVNGYPEVRSEHPIQWNSSLWKTTFDTVGSMICNKSGESIGLSGKNSKWNYRTAKPEGFDELAHFMTYSADSFLDKTGAKMDLVNLSILLFPNNSSCLSSLQDVDETKTTESLTSFDIGGEMDHRVWGGLDYLSDRVNAGLDSGIMVNVGIRPWVVIGVLALGMPTNRFGAGLDQDGKYLVLPRPDDWVTVEEYQNLVMSQMSLSWIWESKAQEASDKMKYWSQIVDETKSID